jgi:hypothetical protein
MQIGLFGELARRLLNRLRRTLHRCTLVTAQLHFKVEYVSRVLSWRIPEAAVLQIFWPVSGSEFIAEIVGSNFRRLLRPERQPVATPGTRAARF